jgi:hypothetical protein
MPLSPTPAIPNTDSGFNDWFSNFKTLIAANPTNYGLVAGDGTALTNAWNVWNPAYQAVLVPSTSTTPARATKDNAKYDALAVIRPLYRQIQNNDAVSDALKNGVGVVVPATTRTPQVAPTSWPLLTLSQIQPLRAQVRYRDSDNPLGKAKPGRAGTVQIFASFGTEAATDVATAAYFAGITKSPAWLEFPEAERGKVVTLWTRYSITGGAGGVNQDGPFGLPTSFTVA